MKEVKYIEVDLGHKKVNVRKWKAKDRKNFKKVIQTEESPDKAIIETLVLNCLEDPKIALTYKEQQYMFVELRRLSIKDTFKFSYECDACGKENTEDVNISDINKALFSPWGTINGIEFQEIPNAKYYNENRDDLDEIKEMAFHVKSIDGNNAMGFDEVVEYLEDMEINDFDDLYEKYVSMEFNIDNTKEFICSCGKKTAYEFDEIPGFFPDSWIM